MKPSPPLRFLVLVLGGWVCLRAAVLGPGWWKDEEAQPLPVPMQAVAAGQPRALPERDAAPVRIAAAPKALAFAPLLEARASALIEPERSLAMSRAEFPRPVPNDLTSPSSAAQAGTPPALAIAAEQPSRWSASAWLFLREGGGDPLAPGGSLGGSQTGGRILYRLNKDPARPLAISARAYAPLRDTSGAEAALGLDWKPVEGLPLHVLAERRQAIGREGRSAFALTAYGGVSDASLGPLRIDAYGQAGMVGLRSRDLFADGSAKLSLPLGPVKAGGGIWGAAQPGAEILEAGPQASVRLPVEGANLVLALDWRLRVAGDAQPSGGPTLTLGADF